MSNAIITLYGSKKQWTFEGWKRIRKEPLALFATLLLGFLTVPVLLGATTIGALILRTTCPEKANLSFKDGKFNFTWKSKKTTNVVEE